MAIAYSEKILRNSLVIVSCLAGSSSPCFGIILFLQQPVLIKMAKLVAAFTGFKTILNVKKNRIVTAAGNVERESI